MMLTIFFPLLNFLGLALFGRLLGKMGTLYWLLFNTVCTILFNVCFLCSVVKYNTAYYLLLGAWMDIEFINICWEFVIDPLSIIMLVMVSIISALVHWYSIDYMKSDPHFIRFMSFLSLFTFFMFVLVTAGNFIQLFLGWEGVGICSFILINFWTTRVQAGKAAIKAVLMNRLGDIAFLIALSLLYNTFFTFDFNTLSVISQWFLGNHGAVPYSVGPVSIPMVDIICIFLLLGVVAKSAQIGLHTWLPAAMEGPTPVSALIHAATMVTAGIFLVIRASFLFEVSPFVLSVAVCFGAATAFLSALTAVFLYDLKRIIAYSTCSQLGYMLFATGLSQYGISLFHLVNHAFFKALLFITAGAIIHSFSNEQDIRKISPLFSRSPFLVTALFIGNFAIMGLPFLSGFYSKDLILEAALIRLPHIFSESVSYLLFGMIFFATALTAVYSCRVVYYTVFKQRQLHYVIGQLTFLEQPFFIKIVLSVLMLFSIFSGYLLSDFFPDSNFLSLQVSALTLWQDTLFFEAEFLLPAQKLLPVFINSIIIIVFLFVIRGAQLVAGSYGLVLVGLVLGRNILVKGVSFYSYCYLLCYFLYHNNITQFFMKGCTNNFYYNELYNFFGTILFYHCYHSVFLPFDKGLLEWVGPTGFAASYRVFVLPLTFWYKQPFQVQLFSLYSVILTYFFLVELCF